MATWSGRSPGSGAGKISTLTLGPSALQPPAQASQNLTRAASPRESTSARRVFRTAAASRRIACPPRSTGSLTTPDSRGHTVTTSRRARVIVKRSARPALSVGGLRRGATRRRSACGFSFHLSPRARRSRWVACRRCSARHRASLAASRSAAPTGGAAGARQPARAGPAAAPIVGDHDRAGSREHEGARPVADRAEERRLGVRDHLDAHRQAAERVRQGAALAAGPEGPRGDDESGNIATAPAPALPDRPEQPREPSEIPVSGRDDGPYAALATRGRHTHPRAPNVHAYAEGKRAS